MKYYSFRYNDNWYGGIATAYCSECNLNCIYCYSHNKRNTGKDRTAREVADRLMKLAHKHGIYKCRISGGECTLDLDHLLEVLQIIMEESDLEFYMETNGINIGKNPEKAEKFAKFPPNRLHITVSLKHIKPESFAKLTGASKEWVKFPKKAVEVLASHNTDIRIAFMDDWYTQEEINAIMDWFILDAGVEWGFKIVDLMGKDVTEETLTEAVNESVDVEEFYEYRSVPLKKKEILDILKS